VSDPAADTDNAEPNPSTVDTEYAPEPPGRAAAGGVAADAGAPDNADHPTGTDPAAAGVADGAAGEVAGDAAERPDGDAGEVAGDAAERPDGAGGVEPGDGGELDELSAVLDGGAAEPRRHWLRYPGLFGALTVVALVILVPCGAGTLFLTGAFADPGRYDRVPDACARLTADRVRADFGPGLVRGYPSDAGDESSCTYQGGAASARRARVTLTLTRYGTKGPLSASRMAHAGLSSDASDAGRHRSRLPGLGDEAVRVSSGETTTVLVRRSNLVLELTATGEIDDRTRSVAAAARSLLGSLD